MVNDNRKMNIVVPILIIILFLGVLLVTIDLTRIIGKLNKQDPEVIYRYIPRGFEEEQLDPVYVTDIFETMFSQPSPWVGSIRTYDERKQERINQYFVNQL